MPKTNNKLRSLHLRQTERKLEPFSDLRDLRAPSGGWIRAIRTALGMTATQLAHRLGVSQGTATGLERRESEGAATFASVRRAAEALDCELVYVLLPRKRLSEARAIQARIAAQRIMRSVDHTMRLEAQRVGPSGTAATVDELADDLLRSWSSRIWDASPETR